MTKKIIIEAKDLPSLIAGETDVFLRFRIVSSDRNRVSAWSPIFSATPTIPFVNEIADLQADVATLQGDVTIIEGDVTNLYNISDDNFAISVVL